MSKSKHDLRPMRQSARAGDHSAARALLKLYGFDEIAAEIKRGLPFSPLRRPVAALTAGTGEGDQPGEWEWVNEKGQIENDLQYDPPASPRRARSSPTVLEDEENDDAASRSRGRT